MFVESLEIELFHVPLPIRAHAIKALISLARAGDRIAAAGLVVRRGFADKSVDAQPLQTHSRYIETLIEVCVDVIGLACLQTGRTIAVVDDGDGIAGVIVGRVTRNLNAKLDVANAAEKIVVAWRSEEVVVVEDTGIVQEQRALL